MSDKIEAGSRVVGEKDGKLIVGDVVFINKGWATIDAGEEQVKIRVSELDLHVEEEREKVAAATGMSKKLAAARKQYVKAGKTYHNGDPVAQALHGHDIHFAAAVAEEIMGIPAVELIERYKHLNQGQIRMNIGNRIRATIKSNPELQSVLKKFVPVGV